MDQSKLLSDGWRNVRLGEIDRHAHHTVNPLQFPDEVFEYYSIPAFQAGGKPVLERGSAILSNKLLVDNRTVLFGKLNPEVLKVWLVDSESERRKLASTEFLPILATRDTVPEFLYYLCQSSLVVEEAKQLVSGSTPSRQRVEARSFYNITIPLPPLPEQRAIAHVLRTVQAAREARQREIALERERKAALMAHLFTHGTRGEPTKQTPIGEMPASWEVAALSSRCVVKTSFPAFDTIPQMDTGSDSGELVLALKVSDMTSEGNERFLRSARLSFRCSMTEAIRRKFLRPQSIVFPKRGAAIATNKKRVTLRYAILDPNLIGVEPGNALDPAYLFAFFEQFDLRSLQDNTPIPQLNKHNVETVLLPVPAYEEQREIGTVLTASDAAVAALGRESALLDELFRALLEELMTGRLSVAGMGVLDHEVAEQREDAKDEGREGALAV